MNEKTQTNRIKSIVEWAENENDAKSLSDTDKVRQIFNSLDTSLGTIAARKIIAVKLLPESNEWSIQRCARAAEINSDTWYYWHRKPEFGKICVEVAKKLLPKACPEILKSFLRDAKQGESKNQIIYLQQVGILDKARGDTTIINTQVDVTVIEAERKKNIETGLARLGFATPETLHTES